MSEPTMIPARIHQRGTVYKAQHLDTGLYVRLNCASKLDLRLTDSKRCTWFKTRDQAVECLAAFGPQPIEIERHDA